ncbi:hypothetical protein BD779DRAFT_437960 [Infundibulicybe gibba]|nr:hypothetical protein BD779DRAFT_437960 [Infundibulicybe gibba]
MIEIQRYDCKTSGRHLVKLKANVSKAAFFAEHHIEPIYEYSGMNSFAGRFDDATLNILRSSPDVESISEVPVIRLC